MKKTLTLDVNFNLDLNYKKETVLKLTSIGNLSCNSNIDMQQCRYYEELLLDHDFEQDEVENMKFDDLKQLEYEGKFEVEIEEQGGYDNWTGEHEYDVFFSLKCLEYKTTRFSDLSLECGFFVTGNNDGDYLAMKYLPVQKKVRIEVGHCCVAKHGIIVDVTTLTKLLFEYFDERGNRDALRSEEE